MSFDLAAWYRRYGEAVFRRCQRLARSRDVAMDLTQETFLRAQKYAHTYRGDASPLNWLFAIADRCFLDARPKGAELPLPAEVAAFLLEEESSSVDQAFTRHDVVSKLLERSPADVRQMVIHRYFDELELEEIAEKTGVNEKTVRRKLERFLENARKFLGRD